MTISVTCLTNDTIESLDSQFNELLHGISYNPAFVNAVEILMARICSGEPHI